MVINTIKNHNGTITDNLVNNWVKYIVVILVIVIGWYFTHLFIQQKNKTAAIKAANVYSQFLDNSSESSLNLSKAKELALDLQNNYPDTLYASFASLLQAKLDYTAQDYKQALKFLNWIVDNSNDSGLISIAQLRIARIYNDQNKPQLAIAELLKEHDKGFDVAYYIARGDVYTTIADINKAKDAYMAAYRTAEHTNPGLAQNIRLKLMLLGK